MLYLEMELAESSRAHVAWISFNNIIIYLFMAYLTLSITLQLRWMMCSQEFLYNCIIFFKKVLNFDEFSFRYIE